MWARIFEIARRPIDSGSGFDVVNDPLFLLNALAANATRCPTITGRQSVGPPPFYRRYSVAGATFTFSRSSKHPPPRVRVVKPFAWNYPGLFGDRTRRSKLGSFKFIEEKEPSITIKPNRHVLNYIETGVLDFKIVSRLEQNKRHVKPYESQNVNRRQVVSTYDTDFSVNLTATLFGNTLSCSKSYSITIFVTILGVQIFACLQIRFSYLRRILITIMKLSTLTRVYIGFRKLSSGHKWLARLQTLTKTLR